MKEKLYVVFFALAISAIASLILTFANSTLKARIQRNQRLQEQRAILEALRIDMPEGAAFSEIEEMFHKHTKLISREVRNGSKIEGLELYRGLDEDGETIGYAMKISGPGFWGPIKGFIAVNEDEVTIRGISFFEQEETPGLGGRIVEEEFKRQFVGKQVYGEDDEPGILLTPPKGSMFDLELVKKKAVNEVDAITGATETSSALQRFTKRKLELYDEIRSRNKLVDMPEITSE